MGVKQAKCRICGGSVFSSRARDHKCPPSWFCAMPAWADIVGRLKVYAYSAESAAMKFAKNHWMKAPPEHGDVITVLVWVDDEPKTFAVVAKWRLDLTVSELADET